MDQDGGAQSFGPMGQMNVVGLVHGGGSSPAPPMPSFVCWDQALGLCAAPVRHHAPTVPTQFHVALCLSKHTGLWPVGLLMGMCGALGAGSGL